MDQIIQDSRKIIATLANLFREGGFVDEFNVLSKGECTIEVTDHDNWNGGTTVYGIFCSVPLDIYSDIELSIQPVEQNIKAKAEVLFRRHHQCWIGDVVISPQLAEVIKGKAFKVSHDDLVMLLEEQKSLMVSVATGGPKIKDKNDQYQSNLKTIAEALKERGVENPVPFKDLWQWYGRWSDGSLPQWKDRRVFIAKLFDPVIETVSAMKTHNITPIFEDPTGWFRVDRSIGEIKLRLVQAQTEEQFQAIGLLARETLISVAQTVYDENLHHTVDGVHPSKTDAKRMLEAFISYALPGKSNENIRRHAKASLDLANDLTHRRTADFRLAALCAESTNAVVNILSIISGRRVR